MVVLQFQDIQSMKLFFLDHGHMQNENDSIHSVIEQNKREFQFIIPING